MWMFLLILVLIAVLSAMLWYYNQQESVWRDELRGIRVSRSIQINQTKIINNTTPNAPLPTEHQHTHLPSHEWADEQAASPMVSEVFDNHKPNINHERHVPVVSADTTLPEACVEISSQVSITDHESPVDQAAEDETNRLSSIIDDIVSKPQTFQLTSDEPSAFQSIQEVNPFFAKEPIAQAGNYESPVPTEQLNSFAFELIDNEPLPVITLEEATRNLTKYQEETGQPDTMPESAARTESREIIEKIVPASIQNTEPTVEDIPRPLSQPDPDLEIITLAEAMRSWQDDEPAIASTTQPENPKHTGEELAYEDVMNAAAMRERVAQHQPFPSPKPLPADTETISEDEIRESLVRQRIARRQQLWAEAPVHSVLRNTIAEEEALANLAKINANAPAARRRTKQHQPTCANQLHEQNVVVHERPRVAPSPRAAVVATNIRPRPLAQPRPVGSVQAQQMMVPAVEIQPPISIVEPVIVPPMPIEVPEIIEQNIHFPPPAIVRQEDFQAASRLSQPMLLQEHTQRSRHQTEPAYYPAYQVYQDNTIVTAETETETISQSEQQLAYPLPTTDLLLPPQYDSTAVPSEQQLLENGITIEEKLAEFRVKVKVIDAYAGPVITRYEIEPDTGVRGNSVLNLEKDLARSLGMASIRVVETIPGKNCMGIELPNPQRQVIRISEIFTAPEFTQSCSKLTLALGQDITGQPVVTDLAKAPHLLVAGTTGSGKSVGINSMILSFLFKATPEDVRLIMIDPKMLELSVYEGIPHLLAPVITDMKYAANALNWCVNEMEKRYRLMSHLGVRNLASYNAKIVEAAALDAPYTNPFSLNKDEPERLEKLPFIVVVVDEFADLMMTAGKKIEELIGRLAQKARAAGIHLILATQRPSVDVITGLIKANIPTRIAFQVSSKVDSRTILDQMGAENLLGQGDMLFLPPGAGYPQRLHGAFVADSEVHDIVQYLKQFGEPQYVEDILTGGTELAGSLNLSNQGELDPLFDQAVATLLQTQKPTISSLQRYLRIGYNKAATLFDQMEAEGIVSAPDSGGKRTILVHTDNSSEN